MAVTVEEQYFYRDPLLNRILAILAPRGCFPSPAQLIAQNLKTEQAIRDGHSVVAMVSH